MTWGPVEFPKHLVLTGRESVYDMLYGTGQILSLEGLGNNVGDAFILNFADSRALGITADDDYPNLVIDFPQPAECFDAPQARHGDVEDDRLDTFAEFLVYG